MKSYIQHITCASIVTLGLLGSAQAHAAYLSQVNLYSTIFDAPANTTVGSWNDGTAEFSRTGSATPAAGVSQDTAGWSIASAETGRVAFNLSSAIELAPDTHIARADSANIQSTNNTVIDDFTIGAGGGLANGDAAQIKLQVQLDGEYQLQGSPYGGLLYALSLRAGEGTTNLPEVAVFNTGGISPPAADEFHQYWEIIFDVTVGNVFRVDVDTDGSINPTSFERGESGLNYLIADSIFRVSNVEGYDLNIISAAGAPTSPIPLPAAVWLFGSGLLGLVSIARRKKA